MIFQVRHACFVILSVILLLIGSLLEEAHAMSEAEITREAEAIYDTVMSPFCPGRLLRHCPSTAASELKARIHEQLASGKSKDEVLDYLVSLYGQQILAQPEMRGIGIVAWLAPLCFLAVGLLIVYVWLKSKRAAVGTSPRSGGGELDPEWTARIESEIRKDRS